MSGLRSLKADVFSSLMLASAVDFYERKTESAPITIVGVMETDGMVSMKRLQARVRERLLEKVIRFRAVPRERDGWSYWDVSFCLPVVAAVLIVTVC